MRHFGFFFGIRSFIRLLLCLLQFVYFPLALYRVRSDTSIMASAPPSCASSVYDPEGEAAEEASAATGGDVLPPAAAAASAANDEYHSLSHAYETYLSHDREEQNHWEDVCRSYRQYATFAMAQFANQQYRVDALPEPQRKVLPASLRRETPEGAQRSAAFKEAAIRNQFCLDCILRHAGQLNSQEYHNKKNDTNSSTTNTQQQQQQQHSSDSQMSKVSSVMKSLARDWSMDGKMERDMAYGPIKDSVKKYLPLQDETNAATASNNTAAKYPFRLCVPGAGVGRLACELASLGYAVQGNEFSLYMLLASDFILNGGVASPEKPLRISPFLLESRNVHAASDPMRSIAIPDVDPYSLMSDRPLGEKPPEFSMAGGDFVSIYSAVREQCAWDGVLACFFLDTSPCVVEYLQVIYNMLRPGGYLFNFGPLLWHWSGPAMRPDDRTVEAYHERYSYLDKKYMESVDMSWEDVRQVMVNIGFEFVEERTGQSAMYTTDRLSMMHMNYRCVHFVARKKIEAITKPSSQPTTAPTASSRTTMDI